jgi:hypothetical protein
MLTRCGGLRTRACLLPVNNEDDRSIPVWTWYCAKCIAHACHTPSVIAPRGVLQMPNQVGYGACRIMHCAACIGDVSPGER